MREIHSFILCCAAMLSCATSQTAVSTDNLFTDHMVLQRDVLVPVWGKAEKGENVTVQYLADPKSGTATQLHHAKADESGEWMIRLRPMKASTTGGQLVISGDNSPPKPIVLNDVLVGEVWLGGGQSNMAYGTRHFTIYDPDLKNACESGPHAMLRVYGKEGGVQGIASKSRQGRAQTHAFQASRDANRLSLQENRKVCSLRHPRSALGPG